MNHLHTMGSQEHHQVLNSAQGKKQKSQYCIEDFILNIFEDDLFIYVSHDCYWGTQEAFYAAKVLKWGLDTFAIEYTYKNCEGNHP